jgi:hypothetical protein
VTRPSIIQRLGDFRFAFSFTDECLINPIDHFDFLIRAGDQDHPIRLQAFVLPHLECGFVLAVLVNQHSAQAESGRAALFVTQLNQAAGSLKNLG